MRTSSWISATVLLIFAASVTACTQSTALSRLTRKSSRNGGSLMEAGITSPGGAYAPPPSASGGPAALPQVFLNSAYVAPAPGATTWPVNSGGDLQGAIDQARPGDEIVLQAGAVFPTAVGFILRNKTCGLSDPSRCTIIIRSSALGSLPPEGVRVQPANAAQMPRILATTVAPAIQTEPGAQYYRLAGLEVAVNSTNLYDVSQGIQLNYELVSLGRSDSSQATIASVPHHLVIDRCYIHGHPKIHEKRGIGLNSAYTSIVDSYISEIHGIGQDTQAIAGFNGPGPFKIVNNYLEGAGENVMFGGADPSITNLVPSDIEFRRNHVMKPLGWRGSQWSIKNLYESKNSQRVLIESNVFENVWPQSQNGAAVLFKSTNQDSKCTWCVTQDVTFRYNVIRHASQGFSIAAHPETYPVVPARNIQVSQTLLYDVGNSMGGSGWPVTVSVGMTNVTLDHMTVDANGPGIYIIGSCSPEQIAGLVSINNISNTGTYGWAYASDSGFGSGTSGLNTCAPGWVSSGNVFSGALASANPATNDYPSAYADIGFTDLSQSDYSLSARSPYRGKASGGTDPGVDWPTLRSAITGVVRENPAQ